MKHKKNTNSMIIIEGNVGVGKSTFLNYLKQKLNVDVVYEPNQLWQDVNGNNLLEQFFLDQKRWAYTCQSYILMTRIDQLLEEPCSLKKDFCLIERSVYSGRYCFAKVAKEIGWMNVLELSLYEKLWDREVTRLSQLPSGFIYLRAPAEICLKRIAARGRFEEKPISLDYLKRIEEKYDNWFTYKQGVDEKISNLPVLTLDFTENLEQNPQMGQQYLGTIKQFLKQL